MRVASVIIDITTQAIDRAYTYALPGEAAGVHADNREPSLFDDASWFDDGSRDLAREIAERRFDGDHSDADSEFDAEIGAAVLVPFGGRKAVGLIIAIEEADAETADLVARNKIKTIERVLSKPYFDGRAADLARYLSERCIAPLSSCIRLFTPPGAIPQVVRDGRGVWHLKEQAVAEVDDRWAVLEEAAHDYTPRRNAFKQIAIIEALRQGDMRVADLALEMGNVSSVLGALERNGVIRIEHRRRIRGDGVARDGHDGLMRSQRTSAHGSHELTAAQADALDVIREAVARRDGSVVLVDGVTGSGKTEVYLRAIQSVLEEGRNAIVLVPEISLTPQTVARFRGRFGERVAVMHSRMSAGERYDAWDVIRSGGVRVVVGARSALFTPLGDVGLIVIDEEHEGSYKQDSAPRYHARDVAIRMMEEVGGTVVLGSATPSLESLHNARTDPRWFTAELPERVNGKPMPDVEVVDMAREFKSGSRAMFSKKLVGRLVEELEAGHKAVLLLNQRGFAKFLLCRDCGYVPECPSCSTSLTYHEQGMKLVCHHCGHEEPVPPVCPECSGPYLKRFGAGTQRVEAELRALIDEEVAGGAEIPLIRMDADTTKTKGAHERLLKSFAEAPRAVLLGTQMIAKGLDFDDVTLVGVINADTQLHLPDYRAAERTFDLIEQVAGRAGRGDLPGTVLVQTYEPQALAIRAAACYDRDMFTDDEFAKRRMLGYPPFVRMANVLVWGKDEQAVIDVADELHAAITDAVSAAGYEGWTVLAPVPCVLERLRGNYRRHIVVKAPVSTEPGDVSLSEGLGAVFRMRTADPRVNVAVDIDPVDVL